MLTKDDAKMSQGIAILAMLMLHLFCRLDNLPYHVHLYVGNTQLIYYFGLFGDICVPIYCFTSGYAQYVLSEKEQGLYRLESLCRLGRFLLHFELIVLVFSVVGVIVGDTSIPGSWDDFWGNVLLYGLSYNGAWWFALTYVFLILLAPLLIQIVKHVRSCTGVAVFVITSCGYYFISYLFEFSFPMDFSNPILGWIWRQILLLGRTQFPFILGVLFSRYSIITELKKVLHNVWIRRIVIIALPAGMFLFHCIVQSLIVAPATAITTLSCFYLWKKPQCVCRFFQFMGRHSMNIWLTHMFFYMRMFQGLVFIAKEPILILLLMLSICLAVSCGIDWVEACLRRLYTKVYSTVRFRK